MPDRDRLAAYAPSILIWFVVVASGLAFRPLLPVDETRYLTVAWEMWWRGDLLVPRLNGAPYAHKPPLLFWAINLAWWVFGVSETAARLVPAAFTLGSAGLTAWIARSLWPDRPGIAPAAALALLGFGTYVTYGSLVLFDVPLAFFVLIALGAVVAGGAAWRWPVFAIAFAAALLTKGPVAAVFVLPPVLLAPLWRDAADGPSWVRWYLAATVASLAGIALAMAWALPAAAAGGDAYAEAILWRQTAGRVVKSFAHAQPWWFYIGILPLLLYPWILMPMVWRKPSEAASDRGLRLCLVAFGSSFCLLAAVSGKQIHYLLPVLPFAALFVARRIHAAGGRGSLADVILPAVPVVLVGLAMSLGPTLSSAVLSVLPRLRVPAWVAELPPAGGVLLVIGVVALCSWRRRAILGSMVPPAAGAALLIMAVNVVGSVTAFSTYDLRPLARHISAHRDSVMAYNKDYEGEFGFLARLTRPLARVNDNEMAGWMPGHAGDRIIVRYDTPPHFIRGRPEFEQPYRGQRIGVWVVPDTNPSSTRGGGD